MNGTNSTTSDRLSGKEVCDIIEACKGSSVSEIQCEELHILFGVPSAHTRRIPAKNEKTDPIKTTQDEIETDSTIQDDLTDREQEVAELILTNPEKYEEMIHKDELEDNTNGGQADETA